MADMFTPSPTMRACLEFAFEHEGIRRIPGGFWVKPGAVGSQDKDQSFGTTTVRACVTRGWLKPDTEPTDTPEWRRVHRITPEGLRLIRPRRDVDDDDFDQRGAT